MLINALFIVLVVLASKGKSQVLDGGEQIEELPRKGICSSLHIIGNAVFLEKLRNCSVIVGFLHICSMTNYKKFNSTFPNLREITEYLVFYDVQDLHSLGDMFPNLSLIRGDKLFANYALIVYSLYQLKEIGLRSLTMIMDGYVRIEKNPVLCYENTINWEAITGGKKGHFIGNNGLKDICPGSKSCRGCEEEFCWSSKSCQRFPTHQNCHLQCMGGCTPTRGFCTRCKHYNNDGVCVSTCPPNKYPLTINPICLTKEECFSLYQNAFIWNETCVLLCPHYYKKIKVNDTTTCEFCGNDCNVVCSQRSLDLNILTFDSIREFKGCKYVSGNLDVTFMSDFVYNEDIMKELMENFQDIEEIEGYLKISQSDSITSLDFLKNLTVIRGKSLFVGKYAFVVKEMKNLQYLWNWEQKKNLTLLNGTALFHYNSKLCMKEILQFKNVTNVTLEEHDAPAVTNGFEVHCFNSKIPIESRVLGPNSVFLIWDTVPQVNKEYEYGYMLYYIENPPDNHTHFTRGTCYKNSVQIKFVPEPERQDLGKVYYYLNDLEPYTLYGYYVETFHTVKVNVTDVQDGRSDVGIFRTEMGLPPTPINLDTVSTSHDTITIVWDDDPTYNGIITHYLIEIKLNLDDIDYLDQRNYCVYPPVREDIVATQKIDLPSKDNKKDCTCNRQEWDQYIKEVIEKLNISTEITPEEYPQSYFSCEVLNTYNLEYCLKAHLENPDTTHQRMVRYVDQVQEFHNIAGAPVYKVPLDNVTVDNVYHAYSNNFSSKHKNYTMGNLMHYGKYFISLAACRNNDNNCSHYNIILRRTLPDADKDKLEGISIEILNSNAVQVSWKEPERPNGAMLYYTIQYVRTDIENAYVRHKCVPRKEHDDNDGKIVLFVETGIYKMRIKAHSLGMDGEFSIYYNFSTKFNWWWIVAFCTFSLIILTSCIYWYYRKWSKSARHVGHLLNPITYDSVHYRRQRDVGGDIEFEDVSFQ